MIDDDDDSLELQRSIARSLYLMSISVVELFNLTDDDELCGATFTMIARVWGDGMELPGESDVEHVIVMISMLDGIIGNGGFEALFSGEFKIDPDFCACLNSLRFISAEEAHEVFNRALLIAGDGPTDVRSRRYCEHPKDLRWKLSLEWFALGPQLKKRLATYIRANRIALEASWRRVEGQPEDVRP